VFDDPDRLDVGRAPKIHLGIAPGRFRFDESQHSSPVRALTEPDDQIRDAAVSCPVEAILLTDTDTGKPVPLDD
jgi:ferredoxin